MNPSMKLNRHLYMNGFLGFNRQNAYQGAQAYCVDLLNVWGVHIFSQ